jgi:Cysteine-rich CPCC
MCGWEDDPVQLEDPDYRGGANRDSLREHRTAFESQRAAHPDLAEGERRVAQRAFHSDESPGRQLSRPLSPREREILEFLLSVEVPGITELRQQVDHALAVPWKCGCASIDLIVDRETAPASSIAANPAIETTTTEKDDPERYFDLLVWVEAGFLSGLEIVDYGESHGAASAVFPPPADFDPPRARSRS